MRLNRFSRQLYEALVNLPSCVSTPPRQVNPELRSLLEAARLNEEWYRVTGGEAGEFAPPPLLHPVPRRSSATGALQVCGKPFPVLCEVRIDLPLA